MTDQQQLQPVPIQRWDSKPTSGRSVYKGRESGDWFWQCDLHDEDPVPDDQWGRATTMREAFDLAVAHASSCHFRAVRPQR